MAEADEKVLNERRHRLAALFRSEEEGYRNEIDSMAENSADRAKRMIVYARQRKEEREAKRQAFADEAYQAQIRYAACYWLHRLV